MSNVETKPDVTFVYYAILVYVMLPHHGNNVCGRCLRGVVGDVPVFLQQPHVIVCRMPIACDVTDLVGSVLSHCSVEPLIGQVAKTSVSELTPYMTGGTIFAVITPIERAGDLCLRGPDVVDVLTYVYLE